MMDSNPTEPMKMLPGGQGEILPSTQPARQLAELPRDELETLATELGLDPSTYHSRQFLVAAIHERRQMIAAMDREAMLDVIKWGRRPVAMNSSKELIAKEIVQIQSMRFAGLNQRGLVVLARLRGIETRDNEPVPLLVRRLKKQEGLFAKLNRKRRSALGSLVSRMVGETDGDNEYRYLPPVQGGTPPSPAGGGAGMSAGGVGTAGGGRSASIKEEIEDSGLIGGITGRLKKTADSFLNQKLDEIEARIDRKLDEIDRRLAEWRDKEIANRIRILKITLWASVIVAALSLVYSYVKVYFYPHQTPTELRQNQ